MKRLFKISLVFALFFLCSCGFLTTETIEIENEVKLTISEDYIPYLGYDENNIPTFTFKFPGKLNVAYRTTGPNEVVFTNNDDFVVSDLVEELLTSYEENGIISYRFLGTTKKYETHMNKKVTLDDGTVKSEKVYLKVIDGNMSNEIAYITLDNGLQLTINYLKFQVEQEDKSIKTYYSWQYSESIRMILYYPLMVVKDSDGNKKILIVALPNATINKIEPRLDVNGLMKKDSYLDSSYYTYPYSDYDSELSGKDYDNSEIVSSIKDYYTKFYNGYMENDKLIYTYLGYTFSVEFNKTTFTISYVE